MKGSINANMMNQTVDSFSGAPGFLNQAINVGAEHRKRMITTK
tara:strand:+ start:1784 stop:1912 length:129 start_codon:yes stop_codon:yes gene_type:complete